MQWNPSRRRVSNLPLTMPRALQYTAAVKTSALDPVSKAMESLHSTFKKDPKLQEMIKAPALTAGDKQQIVAELMKTVGGQDKGDVVKNFLTTLAENNRLGVLEAVTGNFATLMGAHRGEVELVVTSAAVCTSTALTGSAPLTIAPAAR